MSIEHEYGKIENILYSQSLDLLLEWGRIHLFQQKDTPMLQELEGKWEFLKAVGTPLDAGLDLLEGRMRTALTILHGPATIHLKPKSAGNIMAAIKTLDQVVFLSEALESFPTVLDLPPGFREKSDDLLHRVTIERTPPTLRLIPLNEWRREVLKNIPSQVNYLFPWYGLWVELPVDFLDTLTDRFNEAALGDFRQLPLDPTMVPVLLGELKSDPALLERVRRDSRAVLLPPPGKETGLSDRLFQLHAAEIVPRPVPGGLREVGLLVAACQAVDAKPASTVDRTEHLFLAAFCAPFLEEEVRRTLLAEIEAALNRLDPASLHSSSLLDLLCFWSKGRLSDPEFVKRVWSEWESRLARAASQIDEKAVFLGAVENLRGTGISGAPDGWFRMRWKRLSESLENKLSLKWAAILLIIGIMGITGITLGFAFFHLWKPKTPPPSLSPYLSIEPESRMIKRKIPAQSRPPEPEESAGAPDHSTGGSPDGSIDKALSIAATPSRSDPFEPLLKGIIPDTDSEITGRDPIQSAALPVGTGSFRNP